jgi:hypothetical protein
MLWIENSDKKVMRLFNGPLAKKPFLEVAPGKSAELKARGKVFVRFGKYAKMIAHSFTI